MTQPDAWQMVRRRALAAGIATPIGNHSFRATGITAYLTMVVRLSKPRQLGALRKQRDLDRKDQFTIHRAFPA